MPFSIETYGQLEPHFHREWLLTNGAGAFASGTIVGCNTRRYHGLLCAATVPPVGRIMSLNRIAEKLLVEAEHREIDLSVNRFGTEVFPRGERYLQRFVLDRTAAWDYDAEGIYLRRELQLCWQRNLVGLRYTIDPRSRGRVLLQLVPFVSLRDFHALTRKSDGEPEVHAVAHGVSVARRPLALSLRCDAATFHASPDWWFGHTYPLETHRGLDDTEDLFTPGRFELTIDGPTRFILWCGLDLGGKEQPDWDAELRRRAEHDGIRAMPTVAQQRLVRAAADFIVARTRPDGSSGTTLLAGYPWFADWGRDTMISLPGLLLSTGRFDQAGQVLTVFAEYVSEGMIPNLFDDYTNQPHYNTVDASLWFIHACFEYLRLAHDRETFDEHLLPACRAILEGYRRGTRYGIRMDHRDGLITAGDPGTQLTWMDAKTNGVVHTPRHGKPVEINALWHHALWLLGEKELAERVADNFRKAFWISPFRGLADVVHDDGTRDTSIRPNQVFAVSLSHSPLTEDQQHAVVEVVRRELLTPFGLRTLSPTDPKFQPHFRGDPFHRDRAYHNGTIWPWLIGGFLEGYLRVHRRSPEARQQARTWLQPLIDHLEQSGCVGSISEVFEAEPPHRPDGCFAQAWSVAEVLRLALELEM